jgi:hypothetical protein
VLDLVGVQDVRWEGEGYQTADNHTLRFVAFPQLSMMKFSRAISGSTS